MGSVPRRSARRPFALAVVLALAVLGVAPGIAHADDPIRGGESRDEAVPLEMTTSPTTYRVSNEGITSVGTCRDGSADHCWNNVAWFAFTPATDGTLTAVTSGTTTSSYDPALELWHGGSMLVENDDSVFGVELDAQITASVSAGVTYLLGLGTWYASPNTRANGATTLTLTYVAPPSAPQDVVVTAGDGRADVTWAPPSHPYGELLEYAVSYRDLPDGEWTQTTMSGDEFSHAVEGLTNGQEYEVRLQAGNPAGWSEWTVPIRFTPKAVATLTVHHDASTSPISGDTVSLSWAVESGGAPPPGTVSVTFSGVADDGHPWWITLLNQPVAATLGMFLRAGEVEITVAYPGTTSIEAASETFTLTVAKRPQSVGFAALPGGLVVGGAPVPLVATSSEGLPVTFAAAGACAVDGDVLSFPGVGECTVTASAAGTSEVEASSSTQVVTVAKRSQVVTLSGVPAQVTGNGQFTVTGTSSVGLPVTVAASGTCMITGDLVTVTGVGECTVTATAGDAVTLTATDTATVVVTGGSPELSLILGFEVGDVLAGSPVSVTGTGLRPSATATVTVFSTPQVIGTATAAATGEVTVNASMPALAAGEHRLEASATGLDGTEVTSVVRFAVDESGVVTWIGAPGLAISGATITGLVILALVLLTTGAALITTRRRVARSTTV